MQKKLLRTVLFGFSKAEVCEYITKINCECNEKLAEQAAQHAKEKAEMTGQIAVLTQELDQYKQANADIAQALYDAQKYAGELRAKADEEYRNATMELLALKAAQTEKLQGYTAEIEKVRKEIARLLSQLDESFAQVEEQTEDLIGQYRSEEGTEE